MRRRLDRLAELGTTIITLSGGEPLLHPEVDDIIAHIRKHGIMAGMITNGFDLLAVPDYWQDVVRGILIICAVAISSVVDRS